MAKQAHYRVTIGGSFGSAASNVEQWQCSLLVDEDTPGTSITAAEALTRATAIYSSAVTNLMSRVDNGVVFGYCDIRKIGSDGKQPRNPDGSYEGAARYLPVNPQVNAGTPRYPFQTACVVSLVTPRQGPTGKGRIFLPAPAAALDADGRLSATSAQSIATGAAAFINAINGQFASSVSVMSSYGFASTVTGVRVGRVLDTHRSRRTGVKEEPGTIVAVTP